MVKWSVIIPAAGSGERLGSPIPKPFIVVAAKTILEHTISKFLQVPGLIQVVVATSVEHMPRVQSIFEKLDAEEVQLDVVEGGVERQFSIYNALKNIREDATLVGVHDAVRPFITPEKINECCVVAASNDGAIVGVPAKDTIKKVEQSSFIKETPERSLLWQAQTPQVFQKEILLKAYERAVSESYTGTDDASLVERIGGKVKVIEGDRDNFKITYPIDLQIAKLILGDEK